MTTKLALLPVCVAPPAIAALWLRQAQQAASATGVPTVESSVLIKLVETSVVGAALFATLWLVWRVIQRMDQITQRYEDAQERMRLTFEKDIESRAAQGALFEAGLKSLAETKACIYTRDEAHCIAAEVVRIQRDQNKNS